MNAKQRNLARPTRRWQGLLRCGVVLALSGLLCACSTTGRSFDTRRLNEIVPGQTTLDQAIVLLEAEPEIVYRHQDGSALARWAHKASFVPDAVYFRRELWLKFDRTGRFDRVVNKINVVGDTGRPHAVQTSTAGVPASASTTQPAPAVTVYPDPVSRQLPTSVPRSFPYGADVFYGPTEVHPVR